MKRTIGVGLLGVLGALGMACGGGGDGGGTGPNGPPVTVAVTPARDTLTVGTSAAFHAAIGNSSDTAVTWTLSGPASPGSISAAGVYTAGASAGTVLVIATSHADAAKKDTATVIVVAAPSAVVSGSDSVIDNQAGLVASVAPQSGVQYTWAITGGSLTAGQGTSSITWTSAAAGAATVSCTVRNLADSAVTGSHTIAVVAGPVLTSFSAARDTVTSGEGAVLTAVFSNGTATINQGVGAVTSGIAVTTAPLATAYVRDTFTLTVTGALGVARTATVAVTPVNPPVLTLFRAVGPRAPVGGHAVLQLGWNLDPGVVAQVQPGIGVVTTNPITTGLLSTPGPVLFTATVTSPADSVLTDTVTVTAVPPAAGAFQAAGALQAARAAPVAVALPDGRVLVAGGTNFGGNPITSAELYDPGSQTFSLTGPPLAGRVPSLGALLPTGDVLVYADSTLQRYDTASGTFGAAASPGLVSASQMVMLPGGLVLLIGLDSSQTVAARLYDPAADTVGVTGAPLTFRPGGAAILLGDGRVLYAGGSAGNTPLASAEIYDPATGLFTATGSMHTPHYQGAWSALPGGGALTVGGYTDFITTYAAQGEVFDPTSGTWSLTGPMAMPRTVPTATLLGSGVVLVAGGLDPTGRVPSYDEVFDPGLGEFIPTLAGLTAQRTLATAVLLPSGGVLLIGGAFNFQAVTAVEVFQ